MGKLDKILLRIKNGVGTISYDELSFVLTQFGYVEIKTGKTSGSRVAFLIPNEK